MPLGEAQGYYLPTHIRKNQTLAFHTIEKESETGTEQETSDWKQEKTSWEHRDESLKRTSKRGNQGERHTAGKEKLVLEYIDKR